MKTHTHRGEENGPMPENELLVKVSSLDYTASALTHYETELAVTECAWEGGGYGQVK